MTSALTSLWNGSLHGKREQEIRTPPEIFVRVIAEWGEITLDATADSFRWIPARYHWVGEDGLDATILPWCDRSYSNPEYKDLKTWILRAADQAREGNRIAVLCPARSHRKWYRAALRTAHALVEFNPVTFYSIHPETGQIGPHVCWDKRAKIWRVSAFPAPLVLIAWNWIPRSEIWAEVGDVRKL